jgi:hypothetical protein
MKLIIPFTLVLLSTMTSFAWSEEGVEVKDMGQMLAQINLEKKQMENIVDKLVISGRLSPTYADRAKREIASVKEEDAEQVKSRMVALMQAHQKN